MASEVAAKILKAALLDIRLLARRGEAAQVEALADAVHNVPMRLLAGDLEYERFLSDLKRYQLKYGEASSRNYPLMLEKSLAG